MSNDTSVVNHELALVAVIGQPALVVTPFKIKSSLIARGIQDIEAQRQKFEDTAVQTSLCVEDLVPSDSHASFCRFRIYYLSGKIDSLNSLTDPESLSRVARAAFEIGNYYDAGKGVEKSKETAFHWFSKAADLGHSGAIFKVGTFYEHGHYVSKSLETAFNWYLKAANLGDIDGQFNVGNMYFQGAGTEKNNDLARVYWHKAAAQGDEDAQKSLDELLAKQK